MIRSFKSKDTEALFRGSIIPKLQNLRKIALRKLDMLSAATKLSDLRAPPANRLEALSGDRKGQHSIRINDQFRICFVWTDTGPEQVEIVDCH
jgi:proteic killer suppression protein